MKITNLITNEIRTGRTLKASSWRAVQVSDSRREIWHYSTMMAVLDGQTFQQVSNGWGSMSDKHGMNKLRKGVAQKGYTETV
jgi:hypothetical protein